MPDHDLASRKLGNRLLAALPEAELEAILPHLEPVYLETRQLAFDVNRPIEHVYFPESGVVSIVSVMRDGSVVEVATVGNEGMIGLPVFLRVGRTLSQAFSQIPGAALRMQSHAFSEAAARGAFNDLMHHYTQALFAQVSQTAACNRLHLAEERFARWVLMMHDRVGSDDFPLTQDFLAQMLGVRRATVSEVASQAQRDGVIRYRRGKMAILNRAGLERRACECYAIMRAEFEQTVGNGFGHGISIGALDLPSFSQDGSSTTADPSPHEHAAAARTTRGE